jgi:hypothetical protein
VKSHRHKVREIWQLTLDGHFHFSGVRTASKRSTEKVPSSGGGRAVGRHPVDITVWPLFWAESPAPNVLLAIFCVTAAFYDVCTALRANLIAKREREVSSDQNKRRHVSLLKWREILNFAINLRFYVLTSPPSTFVDVSGFSSELSREEITRNVIVITGMPSVMLCNLTFHSTC